MNQRKKLFIIIGIFLVIIVVTHIQTNKNKTHLLSITKEPVPTLISTDKNEVMFQKNQNQGDMDLDTKTATTNPEKIIDNTTNREIIDTDKKEGDKQVEKPIKTENQTSKETKELIQEKDGQEIQKQPITQT